VIEIEDLQKSYRRLRRPTTIAIDHLDLVVPEGGVFGFLGPNGSGKTTTIRCLLGLVRPTSGTIRLLGQTVPRGLAVALRSVGSAVENAAFLPTMSAREQVRLLAAIDGIPARRADDALERVGLGPRAGDTVKGYSLGMRQRLALAVALLKDPALLVLDEPANGLDPAGMRDIRQLLRTLGDEGRTVFLSSHLLSEVEQTCDRVAILSRGRCVLTAGVRELLHERGAAWLVRVREEDTASALAGLAHAGLDAHRVGVHLRVRADDGAAISRTLAGAGVWLTELRQEESHLEDLFLDLTGPSTMAGAA
jgi:ABC-2 type transport system ATP-binding protein